MNHEALHTHPDRLARWQRLGLMAGAGGLVVCALGLLVSVETFFQSYLFAYLFWMGVAMGCLGLLMLHHVVAGAWGKTTQRLLEAGALPIVAMAVLFVPILFGLHELYEWTHADVVAEDEVLQHKRPYLNVPFFLVRAAIYFASWVALALLFRRWSRRLDDTGDISNARKMRRLGAGGLIVYVLTMTFASVDWAMSLEPHWFSTIYGFLFVVSQVLTALAVTIMAVGSLSAEKPMNTIFRTKHLHDYGNLLLTFVVLWSYMMFMQYIIIWSANLPEDITWYVRRQEGLWFWFAPFLIVFHFAVPFFLLLSRRTKRVRARLQGLAAALFTVHIVSMVWVIFPAFHHVSLHAVWMAAAAFIGMGGVWTGVYAWGLQRAPLIAYGDPRIRSLVEQTETA